MTTALAVPSTPARGWQDGWRDGLAYGGLATPLAFVALPLYVVLPNHYATAYGVPLAALGAVLLVARLLDALVDPFIGRWADALFGRSTRRAWIALAAAALLLALGFAALFHPPALGLSGLLWWCAIGLAVTYLGYSVVGVIHQAWGARLGGGEGQRARIVAWREGSALAGVLAASVLSAWAGLTITAWILAALLVLGVLALRRAPQSGQGIAPRVEVSLALPWREARFRRLMAIYLCNGIASAIPATLVLFFIRDRLQAPAFEPLFLGLYFAAAAAALPLWVRLVARIGLARTWLSAMALGVASFAWASQLGSGDVLAFALVCLASGVALGADLTLPGALLTGVIQRAGHAQRAEGAYFGWWNFATKLNLALAAGLALPALQALGYAPGARDEAALAALTLAYCLLPCALKLAAGALLYFTWLRRDDEGRT